MCTRFRARQTLELKTARAANVRYLANSEARPTGCFWPHSAFDIRPGQRGQPKAMDATIALASASSDRETGLAAAAPT